MFDENEIYCMHLPHFIVILFFTCGFTIYLPYQLTFLYFWDFPLRKWNVVFTAISVLQCLQLRNSYVF